MSYLSASQSASHPFDAFLFAFQPDNLTNLLRCFPLLRFALLSIVSSVSLFLVFVSFLFGFIFILLSSSCESWAFDIFIYSFEFFSASTGTRRNGEQITDLRSINDLYLLKERERMAIGSTSQKENHDKTIWVRMRVRVCIGILNKLC